MKKLLNISVIAALAVLPVAANAAAVAGDPTHADPATVATANPGYALVESDASDSGLATAGYVKGAYNAAIKAINKVATTADSAVKGVQVNGTDLTLDANGKANVTVAEGTTNGTVAVNGADVSVHGLGTAAYTAASDYATAAQGAKADTAVQSVAEGSTNGTVSVDGTDVAVHGLGTAAYTAASDYATAAQGAKADTALQTGNNISLLTNDAGYLTSTDLDDYATQDGVLATIGDTTVSSSFSNGSVTGTATGDVSSTFSNGGVTLPIVSTWGATSSTDTAYANSVTGNVTSTFSNGAVTGSATGTVTSTVSAPANYNPGA